MRKLDFGDAQSSVKDLKLWMDVAKRLGNDKKILRKSASSLLPIIVRVFIISYPSLNIKLYTDFVMAILKRSLCKYFVRSSGHWKTNFVFCFDCGLTSR